ncbi:division protein CdvB (Snf7/Vps24/ESCRT-III family) [Paraburkholderia sp. HC6.4b]|uniref:hypothetical protein n=1 Tax=unclassified Paraburkholderia TaxID=2615204 RepID=UPI00160E1E23|nr:MULTISPECIES: hypothetical protein [unclassified Paraburkholderia]MBB5409160.1 division protein CdvB (Snf7/Vps24/ESCRT-III family) [Paraburkholderia sp. HC6.4b]MBB5450888.1 division protein CdvB (Snf7/Vps24/ESCRT-III family) [Paraburkholderia sp. Kb1A]
MSEAMMYTLYRAKAALGDFNDAFFPADPDDPAAQLKRNEELIEELDELLWVHDQIGVELTRIRECAQSEADFAKLQVAATSAQEDTPARGYHRVAEFYRRLTILREL